MEVGYHPEIILAGRRINDNMGDFIAEKTVSELTKQGISPLGANITILGLSFKENCPDLRNTKVVSIIKKLEHYNCNLTVSDSWVLPDEAKSKYDIELQKIEDIKNQDAIIIAVAHEDYLNFLSSQWEKLLRPQGLVVDVKSIFNKDYFQSMKLNYWSL